MKKIISIMLFMLTVFVFAGCQDFLDELQASDSQDAVTAINDLEHVEHFRPGALEHIFLGEINRHDQAVGFHYEGVEESNGETIDGTASQPNEYGVYTAKVRVDGIDKQSNGGKSSFFPKEWDTQEVVDAVNEAYDNRVHISGNTFAGLIENGMTIRMYLDDEDRIISAFPEY